MLRRTCIVLVLALLAPGGVAPAYAHDPEERLDQIESEIRQKQKQIRAAEQQRRGLLGQIAASDQRRNMFTLQIGDLAMVLGDADRRLSEARADLDSARGELRRWNGELGRSQAALDERRSTLGQRASVAYRMGPAGYLQIVLGASDLRTLADRATFAQHVLVADADLVAGVTVARDALAEHRDRVLRVQRHIAERTLEAKRERDRIARLKARQEALRHQIDMEIGYRRGLVASVQETKAGYEQAVADLQADSARIRGDLENGGSTGGGRPGAQLAWPTAGPVVSGFGWRTHPIYGTKRFHAGIDIDGSCGQSIVAADAGRVVSAGWRGGYGQATLIDHGDGLSTMYAHQSAFAVGAGAQVTRGQRIGSVGTTGWSTGCHLHFEVRVNGEPVDPMSYLG